MLASRRHISLAAICSSLLVYDVFTQCDVAMVDNLSQM